MRVFLLAVAVVIFPLRVMSGDAADSGPAGIVVSLEDFIRQVPREDRAFRRILVERLKLKYKKDLDLPTGDWIARVLGDYEFDFESPGGSGGTSASMALDKLFPRTGTTLSMGVSGRAPDSAGSYGSWELGLTQDIARNAFGRAVRLEEDVVDLEIRIIRHQIVEAYEDYLARLVGVYLDWYFQHENLKTARAAHEESVLLLENLRERRRRSVALDVDVDKVGLQVLTKEERVVRLMAEYEVQSNLLRRAMGLKEDASIAPADPTRRWDLPAGASDSPEEFFKSSRTVRILRWSEERGAISVLRYADDLLPSLKLGVSYRRVFGGGIVDDDRVVASLESRLPLGRSKEKARYETAKVELAREKFTTDDVLSRLGTDLRNLSIRIHAEQRRIEMAIEKIRISEGILKEEKENYSFGRTSLNDLIRFVDSLEDNSFAKIARSVARARYLVEWLRLSDRLVNEREVLE